MGLLDNPVTGGITGGFLGGPGGITLGGITGSLNKTKNDTNTAFNNAQPSAAEQQLGTSLQGLVAQAVQDKKNTRDTLLANMGYKSVTVADGKPTLVPLTDDERRGMMSPADRDRSSASQIFAQRAQAALTGNTQLPSFLQDTMATQRQAENEHLAQIMGPG